MVAGNLAGILAGEVSLDSYLIFLFLSVFNTPSKMAFLSGCGKAVSKLINVNDKTVRGQHSVSTCGGGVARKAVKRSPQAFQGIHCCICLKALTN